MSIMYWFLLFFFFFFFNDTATTEIYTLSLHDALPIWDDASSVLPGALRHELLDPVGQARHRRRRPQHQLVPPRERRLGEARAARARGVRVDGERPLEQIPPVHAQQRGRQHPDHGESSVPAAHI